MTEREKVISDLEQCLDDSVAAVVPADTVTDALALLKAQGPVEPVFERTSMKQAIGFNFDKFIERLKEMNSEHGYKAKALGDDASNRDVWTVKGYQDCLEDIIAVFEECLE